MNYIIYILITLTSLLTSNFIFAEENKINLDALLKKVLDEHPRLKALRSNEKRSKLELAIQAGDWHPQLLLSGSGGKRYVDGATKNNSSRHSLGASVTQKLMDFGKTNRLIEQRRILLRQAEKEVFLAEENLLLGTLEAWFDYSYAKLSLNHALQSEANIEQQVKLEQTKLDKGQGSATDVLQAKTQL